ncbi:MAG TPA: TIGR00730 family Rossman fold protein [Flavisolibacter sp.]|nr:TIGR00730 family Rossman fold protein [Flavisolibacter sp.]
MRINKLAIFCGSKKGNHPLYEQHASALAALLAQRKVELIYGGGKSGLMGVVADVVMARGGVVRGVIPRVLTDWEHQHEGISELMVVDDMHVRKRKLYELCDAAVILPGGFGTLDELFEVLTWNQLSIHDKKVFILNTNGFYNHLIAHMQQLSAEGFLYGEFEKVVTIINEPLELSDYLG